MTVSAKDQCIEYCEFQHRHFKTIAAIIKTIPDQEARDLVAGRFAHELKKTNPKFNLDRFLTACGYPE